MRIAIDARLLSGNMTGISRYLWNVVKYLPEFDNKNNYYLFQHDDVKVKADFYNIVKVPSSQLPKQLYSHYWLNFKLPKFLNKYKIDVFFTPYILVPLKKGIYKNVIVIHDSMPKLFKDYYTFHYRKYMDIILPQSIKRSDAIVTVSKSARNDLIKYHKTNPDKTHFMHLWTDDRYKPRILSKEKISSLREKYNLTEKFILYVGAIEERKNIRGIIKITDILFKKGYKIKTYLVGSKGYGYDSIKLELDKRKEKIRQLDYIDEEDLPLLYNLAKLFLFPSHYEGFGLPPLEAMASGLPVLSSNNSSLIEVVGSGGLLADANDSISFVDKIIKLLDDEEFYNKMSEQAIKQARKFTYDLQMPKLIDIFNKFE